MEEKKKSIPTFNIEINRTIDNGKIRDFAILTPSRDKSDKSWKKKDYDRRRDGFLVNEIIDDMNKINFSLGKKNEKGEIVGKYGDAVVFNLSPNPTSAQSKQQKSKYKKFLIETIKKKDLNLSRFKNKKLFIYILIYLRKKRMEYCDVDNFPKTIIDAIKPDMGGDSNITSMLVDKKELKGYSDEDYDLIEQAVVVIAKPSARKDIVNSISL